MQIQPVHSALSIDAASSQESRLSVGELIERFTEDTDLEPFIIADKVAGELRDVLGAHATEPVLAYLHSDEFSQTLADRTGAVYAGNAKFRDMMRSMQDPREQYAVFLRHWACSDVGKKFPFLRAAIPGRYALGHPPGLLGGTLATAVTADVEADTRVSAAKAVMSDSAPQP